MGGIAVSNVMCRCGRLTSAARLCLLRRGVVRLVIMLAVALMVVLRMRGLPLARAGTIGVCDTCEFASIQAAVDGAQAGDTISLLEDVHTESGIVVNKSVTIVGKGSEGTIIQAAETQDAATDRVFTVQRGVHVVMQDLTVRHGQVRGRPGRGGGIWNQGTLDLKQVTVADNRALGDIGDPGGKAEGGGIYNEGVVHVVGSTIASNRAQGGNGYAGSNGGDARGGGIFGGDDGSARVSLLNSTVSGNVARGGSGGG